MKAVRLGLLLVIGVAYILYTLAHPEQKVMARLVAVGAMVVVGALTWLVSGKEAAMANPVAPDEIRSLGLTQAAYDRDSAPQSDAANT